jgi:hypothetical protein
MPGVNRGGARDVEDNFRVIGMEFAVDGGHGAKDLRADVSEHSGAFGGDTVFRKDLEKSGEEEIDLLGGLQVVELCEEIGGKVSGIGFLGVEAGMAEAETTGGVEGREAAAFTALGAMGARW